MRFIGVAWGIIGVSALLLRAILGLTPRAIESIGSGLTLIQWIFLVGFALFMLVAEGYRGFQKKFSPRTAARVRHLRDHPKFLHLILAPFFCMGYFHANKKTKLTAIILTLGVITMVLLVAFLCNDPWRGIIDFGVVLGLSWGLISFWIFTIKALTQKEYAYSAETPEC